MTPLLVVRLYREGDALVSALQVVMLASEGWAFATVLADALKQEMNAYSAARLRYGCVVERAVSMDAKVPTPRAAVFVNQARLVAAGDRACMR